MTSTKGMLLSAIGRLMLREARVAAVREIAEHVREIELEGAALRDLAWTPGDKIQVLLPSLDVRTYTPASWDTDRGATELIVFDHGDSPGASWSRLLKIGDPCRFVGPQRSLRRRRERPAVLFGDETSFGVAAALGRAAPGVPLACVLEVGSGSCADAVIAALGLPAHGPVLVIPRTATTAHLDAAAVELERLLREHPGAELLMSGRAQSIQAVRSRLREGGVRERGTAKAYWAVGKTGLD